MVESTMTKTAQYLTFRLREEEFGIDVECINGILELTPITRIPKTPDYVIGVINVRGRVVPVIDMRLKFGMPITEQTVDTCIIVMGITLGSEDVVLSGLVDEVQEVVELSAEQIEPTPKIGNKINTDFLEGMGKRNAEKFIMILDIEKVFSTDELTLIKETSDKN
ncbi:Chemotaxis protein CheW [subsurface metagenome]